ncbi:hypothetical protein V6N11_003757 [Hibiscus sabdariffa]|uniref:RNase H type-1 domain-containing protein n=1 Tax=Hibiscus sabdariffa TaxID=183260 RepID=A0ABR2SF33_9ROSI
MKRGKSEKRTKTEQVAKETGYSATAEPRPHLVAWCPPSTGSMKMNVDGVRRVTDGVACCGGVLLDSNGVWLAGFSKYVDKCSALDYKFWVAYEGLQCAMS